MLEFDMSGTGCTISVLPVSRISCRLVSLYVISETNKYNFIFMYKVRSKLENIHYISNFPNVRVHLENG